MNEMIDGPGWADLESVEVTEPEVEVAQPEVVDDDPLEFDAEEASVEDLSASEERASGWDEREEAPLEMAAPVDDEPTEVAEASPLTMDAEPVPEDDISAAADDDLKEAPEPGGDSSPASEGYPTETNDNRDVGSGDDVSGEPLDLRNDPGNKDLVDELESRGYELRAVDDFDYSDNPILGWKRPKEDYAWMVKEWEASLAPGLATGATREDFATYDQRHGVEVGRQLASAFDAMLGDFPIKADTRPDGSLNPEDGRHRIELARELGISHLPAKITR